MYMGLGSFGANPLQLTAALQWSQCQLTDKICHHVSITSVTPRQQINLLIFSKTQNMEQLQLVAFPSKAKTMLHSLCQPSFSPIKTPSLGTASPTQTPPLYLKFHTSHRENLRYLKSLGIVNPATKPPSPDNADQILSTISFLKAKGFTEPDFPKLSIACPKLFSPDLDPTDIAPVFDFLASKLPATVQESCGLTLRCPQILFSDVEYCLGPTLDYLRQIGVQNLNTPTNLNAHLLNTRVEKLGLKIRFLRSVGFSNEEAARVCARLPAMFGYSIDNNLRPKLDYLVWEMERSVEELKGFPQYFGFSLEKRIAPRHLHLKQRNVRIPLNRMLLWSDQRFYAKWK